MMEQGIGMLGIGYGDIRILNVTSQEIDTQLS